MVLKLRYVNIHVMLSQLYTLYIISLDDKYARVIGHITKQAHIVE